MGLLELCDINRNIIPVLSHFLQNGFAIKFIKFSGIGFVFLCIEVQYFSLGYKCIYINYSLHHRENQC